jgi:hypothetical protein
VKRERVQLGLTCLPDAFAKRYGGCAIVRKDYKDRLGTIEIEDAELQLLGSNALVARLVSRGFSRLTAERFVEIERGEAEPGRARPHPISRR